ncbi:MAG: hypothetical protein GY851_05535 [bacterium]|nr:hypothetical protein [bacterium]
MLGLTITTVMAHAVLAAAPTVQDMNTRTEWASIKFFGAAEAPDDTARIDVLANNDPVQANGRAGKPMNIARTTYTRGLYCHAVSDLMVRLPEPAARFEAVVGVDTNEQTSGGRGSVVFSVSVAGEQIWESPLMREGMAGVSVSVDLKGASEFRLHISDGGDGITCDQADWAEAKAVLNDGTNVWLGELPLVQQAKIPLTDDPFFSFTYGGASSRTFLDTWEFSRASRQIDEKRTGHTLTYTDPDTGLVVRCEAVEYHGFPTVEWTLHFENTGDRDTPILSDIRAIDTEIHRGGAGGYTLHHHKGDYCTADSFQPYTESLDPGATKHFAPSGGRPTNLAFPYYNIEHPSGRLIFAVSWAGQWAADLVRDAGTGLTLRAGQELTHFTLHPGEEVRTPMIVLQFYHGDWLRAQNVWRAWMVAHNMPRPGGELPSVPFLAACSSHQYGEMINADTASQIFFVDKYLERGITLDYWWMDAGWYVNKTGWPNTGTWEVDTKRFPKGLREITDHAHAKGVKSIVWFEPERVTGGTWLTENHPEWVLGGAKGGLLNLGDPEVLAWLTDHVDALITSQGIDLYRQDFNIDPLSFWRGNDTEDRQGITEIRHVEAYFAYWDELCRRHPGLLIDSCASGGRRNDLETLRRAVPLLRSDYIMQPVGNQCHTHALSLWFPFYGTGTSRTDPYDVYSVLGPDFIACWDMREENLDYARLKEIVDRWKAYIPCYLGDYYPITPYTLSDQDWIAWQFDRAETNQGVVQAFRRSDSIYESARLPLQGLEPGARYSVTPLEPAGEPYEATGKVLMDEGVRVAIPDRPGVFIVMYEAVK